MNTTDRPQYTREQNELIAEFSAAYGLQPEQIRFYTGDPRPFFDRDATAVLIHRLTGAVGIEDDLVPPPCAGSIAVKYRITFEDGSFAGATGVANMNELLDGEPMSPEQVQSLATSRASRGALRNKGIDLVRLHYRLKEACNNPAVARFDPEFSGPARTQHEANLREAHALGYETGLIFDDHVEDGNDRKKVTNKDSWYRVLGVRYGVQASSDLNETQLADFVAFLRSQLPNKAAA